jgi:hypothetical protein
MMLKKIFWPKREVVTIGWRKSHYEEIPGFRNRGGFLEYMRKY